MKQALFLDFQDSFTYNVVQELEDIGIRVKVIPWQDFTSLESEKLLVLGPGPGHPDEYAEIFEMILRWLEMGKNIFGVCLGHQLIWKLKGMEIISSAHPMHGQSFLLPITNLVEDWLDLKGPLKVQRYNSLAVRFSGVYALDLYSVEGDELMLAKTKQIISYQFHPESLGTNCRKSFFMPILKDLL